MDYPQARAINAGRIAELKRQTAIVLIREARGTLHNISQNLSNSPTLEREVRETLFNIDQFLKEIP
jgi:hypothetical protein